MKTQQSKILHSKFIKPRPTSDLVLRTELLDYLSKGHEKPLTLISAPAGYGKSTLISSWLDHQSPNFGWISISEYDSDWLSFIRYFVFGLNNALAGKFEDILSVLVSPEIPDSEAVIYSIINELVGLEEDFYLVLDDYHYLHDPEIHNSINTILQFPPKYFHLIVTTRADPPFRIQHLRSKGLITEIRSSNLVFKLDETVEFFKSTIDTSVKLEVCQEATNITDGWVTGLRLLGLSFRNKSDRLDEFLETSHVNLAEELLDEIFLDFTPEIQQFVLKSSILNQFNISICKEICGLPKEYSVSEVFNHLKISNLFIIPVDEERGWFRFHHFFQDYLLDRFKERYSNEEQKTVHRAAGIWLRNHGLLKGAIIHFTKSDDINNAIEVFEIYRHQSMNESQWPEFSQVLGLFDEKTVKAHIELLLAQAWFNIYAAKPFEMFALLEPIKALINTSSLSTEKHNRYLAEINCLLPYKTYNVDRDFQEVIKQCDFALDNLHEDQRYVKGYAWIFKLGALQAIGKYVKAKKLVAKNLEEKSRSIIDSHLYLVMNYLQWMEADIEALIETSIHLTQYSTKSGKNHEAIANGNHFLGISKYIVNELDFAKTHLQRSYDYRLHTIGVVNIMNSIAIVLLHLAQNNISEAERMVQKIKTEFMKKRSYLFNTILDAVHAEIYLSNNNVDKALNNLKEVEQIPLTPFSNFYAPQFTLVKALIYAEDTSSLAKAIILLKEYLGFAKETHNKLFEMKFLGLLSLQYFCLNEFTLAFSIIQNLIINTKTHRIIRMFLDCGPMMKELLLQYNKSIKNESYVHDLIQAFPLDPNEIVLTTREMEILPLLNLSNKEIAAKLYIAVKTVKRHTSGIFKKFHVKNRREAIQRAEELNLIQLIPRPA